LRESTEIALVYAGFSPVRPVGVCASLQPMVASARQHNYILCFSSEILYFPFRHNPSVHSIGFSLCATQRGIALTG